MDAEIGARANIQQEVDKFLGQSKLDPILLAAMSARGSKKN